MTMIEELKALAEKATPGPWEYETGPALEGRHHSVIDQEEVMVCECYEGTEEQQEANAKLIVALVNNLPAILSALSAVPVMKEALEDIMVGGNHLALLIGADHPPYTSDPQEALEHYGAGDTYEVWCCWRSIMLARQALAALETKP